MKSTTEVLRVRVASACAKLVKKAAKADGRTVSGWLRMAIEKMAVKS